MLCEQVVILMGMVDGVGSEEVYEGVRPQPSLGGVGTYFIFV